MAQVTFDDEEFYGELHFVIETNFEGSHNKEISFSDFDEFSYCLQNFYTKNYKELFNEEEDIFHVVLSGIAFKGRQDTERFAIDVFDGWKRATMIFNEEKFGDLNIEKLELIKKIIND